MDIVGVIKFRSNKEPHDLAGVVTGCVQQISWSGKFDTTYARLHNFKVLAVEWQEGVASVVFEVRARPGRIAAVPVGSAAVTAVWEACNYRFGAGDEGGFSLLPPEDAEIRRGGTAVCGNGGGPLLLLGAFASEGVIIVPQPGHRTLKV
jgi:hypothetical protein